MIIVDDCSTDNSVEKLEKWKGLIPGTQLVKNLVNQGNCKSFNAGLALAKGEFVIDFSCDDVLLPNRLSEDIRAFAQLSADYAVVHSDADLINIKGEVYGKYHPKSRNIPQGDIYKDLVERHFICPISTTIRKSALDEMGAYDEDLAYEDFDLWVRLGRNYKFYYQDKVLSQKRISKTAHSQKFKSTRAHSMFYSTYLVCKKIKDLNRSKEEDKALAMRIRHEMKQAFLYGYFDIATKYLELLEILEPLKVTELFLQVCAEYKIDLAWGYRMLQAKQ